MKEETNVIHIAFNAEAVLDQARKRMSRNIIQELLLQADQYWSKELSKPEPIPDNVVQFPRSHR